ncbi:hypothetical protein ACUJ8H_42720 [Streptomyces sp. EKR5.2]|uniref:hypothetical protein n=1 Tax=Streptomyces sp. EKR5.2 TaxID=3461014 RepID=UPI004042DE39
MPALLQMHAVDRGSGLLVVGAVDHAHVIVERLERPPVSTRRPSDSSRKPMARRSSHDGF